MIVKKFLLIFLLWVGSTASKSYGQKSFIDSMDIVSNNLDSGYYYLELGNSLYDRAEVFKAYYAYIKADSFYLYSGLMLQTLVRKIKPKTKELIQQERLLEDKIKFWTEEMIKDKEFLRKLLTKSS